MLDLKRVIFFYPHSLCLRLKEDGFEKAFKAANITCITPEYNWADNLHAAKKKKKKIFDGGFDAIVYPEPSSEILRHPRAESWWGLGSTKVINIFTVLDMLRDMGAPLLPCNMTFHDHFDEETTLLLKPDALVMEILRLRDQHKKKNDLSTE